MTTIQGYFDLRDKLDKLLATLTWEDVEASVKMDLVERSKGLVTKIHTYAVIRYNDGDSYKEKMLAVWFTDGEHVGNDLFSMYDDPHAYTDDEKKATVLEMIAECVYDCEELFIHWHGETFDLTFVLTGDSF